MNSRIQILDLLSKANLQNKDNEKMEQMYNGIEGMMNILSYVDFAKCAMSLSFY